MTETPAINAAAGCGNPLKWVRPQPGESVLDLGCGGGIDCFIAAEQVGPTGHVIGIDMSPEMIELANRNKERIGAGSVEFRLAEIEALPVEDHSIDVVTSNCVINLSPDKDAVFGEAYRVLKPGGRMCVSDMVRLERPHSSPPPSAEEWLDTVAGAMHKDEYLETIARAGFTNIETPEQTEFGNTRIEGRLASLKVRALKPSA